MVKESEFTKRVTPSAKDASGAISPREHHAWAEKMWRRMDRNATGTITRDELDCEEFRTIVRNALATGRGNTGGVSYERVQQNTQQAISFCLRKADLNHDGSLGFEEFESFLLYLRQDHHAAHTAHLIFALFDLDGDMHLDEREFREIYRFYLGHNPHEEDFQEEWARLDLVGQEFVMLDEYTKWLRTSTNPIFLQHAPEESRASSSQPSGDVERQKARTQERLPSPDAHDVFSGGGSEGRPGLGPLPGERRTVAGVVSDVMSRKDVAAELRGGKAKQLADAAAKQLAKAGTGGSEAFSMSQSSSAPTFSGTPHMKWAKTALESDFDATVDFSDAGSNRTMRQTWGAGDAPKQRFHVPAGANINDGTAGGPIPKGQRNYFSRPQSLPQLGRYQRTHKGFRKHRTEGAALPEEKHKSPVLSNYMETMLPGRYEPGGTMKRRAGTKSKKLVSWEDHWQTPAYLEPRYKPAVLDFRCPGPPPSWMLHYKEDCD